MGLKSVYRVILNVSSKLFGAPATKRLDAKLRFKRKLNLKNPSTLCDKICYDELFTDNPLKVKCTDKYAVRDYVRSKGYEDILVPLCGGPYSKIEEIDFDALPNQFAMKAAHGCEMNLICEDKSKLDIAKARKTVDRWLKKDYARACVEPHYKKIPRRVICEEFLQDADNIIDYKFHCFNGEPDFILVCGNRSTGVKLRLYDLDWNSINEVIGPQKADFEFKRPQNLEKMIEISRKLSADFNFVRVDLYDINGKVYFGELTFSPASGILPNFTDEFIAEKGKMYEIGKV